MHNFAVLRAFRHILSAKAVHHLILGLLDQHLSIRIIFQNIFGGLLNIKFPEAVVESKFNILLSEAAEQALLG
jgi:hypothetical protein